LRRTLSREPTVVKPVVISLTLVLLLGVAAYYAYQDPRVRDLFEPAVQKDDPLEFLRNIDVPESRPRVSDPPRASTTTPPAPPGSPAAGPGPSATAPAEVANQVPNAEVGSVLIQVLKARKLAAGISLGVTDTEIAVYGSVATQEHLDQIVEILEKGRESRTINVSAVRIGDPATP
jgi:hypothetical protein